MKQASFRIAVVVCSIGRPECLAEMVGHMNRQTRRPDRLLFVVPRPEDIGFDPAPRAAAPIAAQTLLSPKGLPRQRNRGLEAVAGDCDIVVFFDDDYVPSRRAIAGIEATFAAHPEVSGINGIIIDDGIRGPGIDAATALAKVEAWDARDARNARGAPARPPRKLAHLEGLYGCNMAYRMSAVGRERFDEALPLYGWQEDIDFAARIPGERIRTDGFAGVHRGVKSGRETSGRLLGYSQVVNPLYLYRKRTMSAGFAFNLVLRNILANHLKQRRPEQWIDRAARARGNRLAIKDLLRGRARPDRILSL